MAEDKEDKVEAQEDDGRQVYKLRPGAEHYVIEKGGRRLAEAGEEVRLLPAQYESFKDKFVEPKDYEAAVAAYRAETPDGTADTTAVVTEDPANKDGDRPASPTVPPQATGQQPPVDTTKTPADTKAEPVAGQKQTGPAQNQSSSVQESKPAGGDAAKK